VSLFLQQAVNGVALGSVYALVALGLTLVYGVMRVPNFAHGALYMAGAYVTWSLATSAGLHYVVATLVSIVAVALLAVVTDQVAFRSVERASPVHQMVVALGLLYVLEGFADAIWGAEFRSLAAPVEGAVTLAGATVTNQRLLVIGCAVLVMVLLHLFLRRTFVGMSIAATAQDREGARLVGMDTRKVATTTFAISGALAAIAGSLIAPLVLIHPHMGETIILKAFVIVILGGMGSVPGAIVGGYLLGLTETMAGTYVAFAFSELIAFLVLVLVLAIRPAGLFGGAR
jgi:branched-chain amino acid transport system permease protein